MINKVISDFKIKVKNKYFLPVILSILLPIIFFGSWSIYSISAFILIFPIIYALLDFKIHFHKEQEWIVILLVGLNSILLAPFGIYLFRSTKLDTVIIETKLIFLIYFTSALSFIILSILYREESYKIYLAGFNNPKEFKRDQKLKELFNE